MTGPQNGDTVSGNVRGKSLYIEEFHKKPGIPVEIQVLRQPGLDPAQNATWAWLAATVSNTNLLYWNSTDPLYSFSVTVVPVPSNPTAEQAAPWPLGKLVGLRAVAKALF